MFCPNCGTEVSDQAMFCIKCGAALGNTTQSNAANQQQFQNPYQQQQPQPEPKTWLVESILVTLFCCLPFGIAGIVNAANVSSKYAAGDYAGATRASKQAGKWTKLAFWLGIAVFVIYIVMVIIFGNSAEYYEFNKYYYGY